MPSFPSNSGIRVRSTQQTQLIAEAHELLAIYNARQHEQPSTQQRNQVTMLRLASLLALLDPTSAHRHATRPLDPATGRNLQLLLQRAAEVRRQLDAMAKELNIVENLHVNVDLNNPRGSRGTTSDEFSCCVLIIFIVIVIILLVIFIAAHQRQRKREDRDPHYKLRNTQW